MIKNKKIIFLLFLIICFLVGCSICYVSNTKKNNHESKSTFINLNDYVLSTDEVILYVKEGDKYKKGGKVGKNVILHIEKYGEYYKVINLDDDYYVKTDNLENTDSVREESDLRYKNYVAFNYNIKTSDKTSFYDDKGNLVYQFNKGYSLPIIIKEDGNYGVEFLDRLLYIHDGKMIDSNNTDTNNTPGIAVLNYHFFYDESNPEDRAKCNQVICASKKQFQEHLDYIKENGYFTPTMEELDMYIDGKIQLPKSVVITIDDGWRADIGTKMLGDNGLNGTLFLITGSYDPNAYSNDYVEIHSHSDNMHNQGDCPVGQGGGIQCLDEEFILNDLKTSSEKLGGSKIFCYPFYEYNDYSISMLKKAGFVMAFAGEKANSDNMVHVGSDKYSLPRFVIVNYTSMVDFKNYLEGNYYS